VKNEKLSRAYAEVRAMIQAEMPADITPGHATWLIAALTNLDSSQSFFESYEAARDRGQDAAKHAADIEKIQRESAEEVTRHHADLAARAERQQQP
jgi:hypothetical protein